LDAEDPDVGGLMGPQRMHAVEGSWKRAGVDSHEKKALLGLKGGKLQGLHLESAACNFGASVEQRLKTLESVSI
jgi:hypothetical protein